MIKEWIRKSYNLGLCRNTAVCGDSEALGYDKALFNTISVLFGGLRWKI
jgi:hypothetical protein